MKNTHKYDDIIYLSRPVSPKRSRMSAGDRAAQFSPFAALTGYDGVIAETGRLTDAEIELDEGGKELLNEQLQKIRARSGEQPRVVLTCYRPDARKQGGSYVAVAGNVKKVDTVTRTIFLTDGTAVPMDRVYGIELFD